MLLTKRDTKIIKGIAILLMMIHHLFAFPKRIVTGFEYQSLLQLGDTSIEMSIGTFGKICVSLYTFLGGYGIYRYAQSGGGTAQKNSKIISVLLEDIFYLCSNWFFIFFESAYIL